jgi:FKBP-type peptidyl-prolyl cis-trans isomerase FkpA
MKYALLSIVFYSFISCSKEKEADYVAEEEIAAYVAKNKLNAQRSDSGLYYVINEAGTGKQPTATSNVTVAYKGYFTNGSVLIKAMPTEFHLVYSK